ncbi:DNA-binding transcriptional regulator DsdC [Vibrio coralliirubri]|uniref:DNA-binding transcriptional regulator DsdC n=1 Tax=Vibrio coralliirubri TaxID=1516159 RepID=UPI000630EBCB|nr:DNA-binding transcriptional regulator DsdC [Vibrio coralliirubri]CDT91983.1 HTH-type transcriptional regulator dsdC [Vibrio coralliirubri]
MYSEDNLYSKNQRLNSHQLSKLHTFEVAARHGSFSLAAQELSMTPSAVSHRINKLEREMDIQLFERAHRRITLTSEGKRIYAALSRTLNDLNQEILDVKKEEISGTFTIYSRPTFAQSWLVPRIANFKQRYPSITLKLLTGNENISFQGHGIDIAIYFDDLFPDKLFCQAFMHESMTPVCTAQYAELHGLNQQPENLNRATLLHDNQAWNYDSNHNEWEVWAQAHQLGTVHSSSNMEFDRSDLAILAAINNAGIAIGRYSVVSKYLEDNTLIAPFNEPPVTCKQQYYFATPSEHQSPKVKMFIEWAFEQRDLM